MDGAAQPAECLRGRGEAESRLVVGASAIADPLVPWLQSWNLHKPLVEAGAESELFLLDGYRHGFVNAERRGDMETENLLDGGRLAAEGAAAAARRYVAADGVGDGGVPAEFGFDHIADFFARHLGVVATPA